MPFDVPPSRVCIDNRPGILPAGAYVTVRVGCNLAQVPLETPMLVGNLLVEALVIPPVEALGNPLSVDLVFASLGHLPLLGSGVQIVGASYEGFALGADLEAGAGSVTRIHVELGGVEIGSEPCTGGEGGDFDISARYDVIAGGAAIHAGRFSRGALFEPTAEFDVRLGFGVAVQGEVDPEFDVALRGMCTDEKSVQVGLSAETVVTSIDGTFAPCPDCQTFNLTSRAEVAPRHIYVAATSSPVEHQLTLAHDSLGLGGIVNLSGGGGVIGFEEAPGHISVKIGRSGSPPPLDLSVGPCQGSWFPCPAPTLASSSPQLRYDRSNPKVLAHLFDLREGRLILDFGKPGCARTGACTAPTVLADLAFANPTKFPGSVGRLLLNVTTESLHLRGTSGPLTSLHFAWIKDWRPVAGGSVAVSRYELYHDSTDLFVALKEATLGSLELHDALRSVTAVIDHIDSGGIIRDFTTLHLNASDAPPRGATLKLNGFLAKAGFAESQASLRALTSIELHVYPIVDDLTNNRGWKPDRVLLDAGFTNQRGSATLLLDDPGVIRLTLDGQGLGRFTVDHKAKAKSYLCIQLWGANCQAQWKIDPYTQIGTNLMPGGSSNLRGTLELWDFEALEEPCYGSSCGFTIDYLRAAYEQLHDNYCYSGWCGVAYKASESDTVRKSGTTLTISRTVLAYGGGSGCEHVNAVNGCHWASSGCHDDTPVRVYEKPNYGGGCAPLSPAGCTTLSPQYYDNGVPITKIASLRVRPGYSLSLSASTSCQPSVAITGDQPFVDFEYPDLVAARVNFA